MSATKLTAGQMNVLTFVAKNDGEAPVSSQFASPLVRRGLMERVSQFNHRGAKRYRLTDAGRIAASTLEVTAQASDR
jgi:hypothetical protein